MAQARAISSQGTLSETLVGLAVVILAVAIGVYSYVSRHGDAGLAGYELNARLPKVDGLGVGTAVSLSGIKVGTITGMDLDPRNYLVTVHMNIEPGVEIPVDSSILVTQSGLLGSSYLSINPGGDMKVMKPGAFFTNVQGSIDLMNLIGRFATGAASTSSQQPPPTHAPQAPLGNGP